MGLPDNCITEEKLPQCWSDDIRMNALFAPFRLKSANPESWDMKMKFWSDLLRQWCRWKKDPVVSAADLKCAFMRKGRTPACLDIVVEEMFRNGELSPLTKYQQILHNGPEGWVRWGARLAFRPAAFALTAVTSLLPARQAIDSDGLPKASIDSTQRFVCESAVKAIFHRDTMAAPPDAATNKIYVALSKQVDRSIKTITVMLQEQATELLENYPNDAERMGTVEELMRSCKWQQSRDTFEMLLGYLVSQGSAVKKDEVIKLAEPNKKATPVTEADEALVRLSAAEARLRAEAEKLSRDAAAAESEARASLQLGNRLAAKNHLRRKHKLQQRVEHTEAALLNVQQLLQQMREVDVNATIVDTYRMSSAALKRGLKDGGLEEDAVHDTMDDLKEVMETYNEVEKALAGSPDDIDMAELEQELKDLLASPGAPPGGGAKEVPKTPQSKKNPEPDFVFDGEERVIAELNELSVEDASPKAARQPAARKLPVPVADNWEPAERDPSPRASKPWYPPTAECLRPGAWNNNELRLDDRLHPGQSLNVDFTTPPKLYSGDFQVRDHKLHSGVWLYNSRDGNSNVDDFAASTLHTRYVKDQLTAELLFRVRRFAP
ncbi:hypothetical protein MSG28_014577 [Choristoneura fumiferana]|uniref:Uncharacterized protein n=1 Tax=Choristoneura fumiferana TaxID=7141 RepID=A0ACC0JS09_CHOFU|nr:hypothetical protein MSG28_014577 [Choristoneura fumiferana]